MNCASCGAPGQGLVCAYCGSALHGDVPIEQELAVLEQYHQLLAQVPVETRVQFLRNGFMPRGEAALIESGIRCLPLLNPWSGDEGVHSPNEDAASRAEAIISRLRIVGTSRESKAAVEELSTAIASYRKRRVTIYVAVFAVLIGIVLLFLLASVLGG